MVGGAHHQNSQDKLPEDTSLEMGGGERCEGRRGPRSPPVTGCPHRPTGWGLTSDSSSCGGRTSGIQEAADLVSVRTSPWFTDSDVLPLPHCRGWGREPSGSVLQGC